MERGFGKNEDERTNRVGFRNGETPGSMPSIHGYILTEKKKLLAVRGDDDSWRSAVLSLKFVSVLTKYPN